MKTIRAYVMDDENIACERMKYLLSRFQSIELVGASCFAQRGMEEILKSKPDVAFLDIELDANTSAFDMINEIDCSGLHTQFILVTAHDHYARKAIKKNVFDYLLKPVDLDELSETIARLEQKLFHTPRELPHEFTSLSDREKEITLCILRGETSMDISKKLFISVNTVHTHRRNILKKMNAKTSLELISRISLEQ